MSFWRFEADLAALGDPLHAHHDPLMVLLAPLVAILAASTLLPVIERYRSSGSRRVRFWWLAAGALAMGFGVWGMHFTAMLGHRLPVEVAYSPWITLFSVVPVMLAAAITIMASRSGLQWRKRLWVAAGALALGIGAMHYSGMEALIAPVVMVYHPGLFLLSLLVALALARLALHANVRLALRARRYWLGNISGSVILGLAVTAMHYVAMAATDFYPDPAAESFTGTGLDARLMSILIALAVAIIVGLLLIATTVDRRLAEMSRSLSVSENRFRLLAEISNNGIFSFDKHFTYTNPAVSEITGYSPRELQTMAVAELFGVDPQTLKTFSGHADLLREVEITTRTGEKRWVYLTITPLADDDGEAFMGNMFDISERIQLEQELRERAFFDETTGLPNRSYFMEQVEQQFAVDKRFGALLLINLDHFKLVNDNFGFDGGDQVLRMVTERLTQRLKPPFVLARVGGDEFGLLLETTDDESGVMSLVQDLQNSFIKPFFIAQKEVFVSISIGIAMSAKRYTSAKELYRDAHTAMHTAKRRNKGGSCVFDTGMQRQAQQRLQMETDLRRAMARRELSLYYQPIVALPDGRWQGFEALLRWRRDDGSFVSPAEFIPVAEESGLIGSIGNWVMEAACQQIEQWNRELPVFAERGYISINVSSLQFFQTDLLTNVTFLLHSHGIRPGQLRLELTEGILVEDSPQLIERLKELDSLGCPLMLDDFGTGYSSLSYLHRFPISVIKIDQSFVREIIHSDTNRHLVQAIISMARALELTVVAEGIEEADIGALLAQMQCDSAQGYYFARPMPVEDAIRYLQALPGITAKAVNRD
ncbi:EAL domain-containing protein [Marinimicrobium alkaliphilum]|uniref:EAL domain-containing protein n=1 Tax=Marinimicrobium alkaliphilum TaxID=2202654 RepID=UPI000DB98A11|nr:EAL domain-containing protein [Marinimicrobium alkaliphilum]